MQVSTQLNFKKGYKFGLFKSQLILLEKVQGNNYSSTKEGLEFGQKQFEEIDAYCKKKEIDWFASAWDLNSLNFLDQFKLKYQKIASAMIVDKIFLQEVAKEKYIRLYLPACQIKITLRMQCKFLDKILVHLN